ncbi:hypothetical protein D9M73_157810 [compost metagenome]
MSPPAKLSQCRRHFIADLHKALRNGNRRAVVEINLRIRLGLWMFGGLFGIEPCLGSSPTCGNRRQDHCSAARK